MSNRILTAAVAALWAGGIAWAAVATSGFDPANFDHSAKPSDDFYEFVNGGWLKANAIPADRPAYGSFEVLANQAEDNQHGILDGLAADKTLQPGSDGYKLAVLYRSFTDEARHEALGLKPLQPELDDVQSAADKSALFAKMVKYWHYNVNLPFHAYVNPDYDESQKNLLYFDQSGLGLPDRDYYLNKGEKFQHIREEYPKYISKLLSLAGYRDTDRRAQAIMDLETKLAEASMPLEDAQDITKTSHKFPVTKLSQVSDKLDWAQLLRAARLDDKDTVNVDQPDFYKAFGELYQSVPLETWKDYATYKLLAASATHLTATVYDASFDFNGKLLSGLTGQAPRWKRGVRFVNTSMGEGLGRYYVAKYFPPEAKARMQALVKNLMAAMDEDIDQLDWMSPATKAAAHDKLSKVTPYIGYPDEWRDYSKLQVADGDDFGNNQRAIAFEFERNVAKLHQPVDKGEWGLAPQVVNAYYSPGQNKIVFPAAILQAPFFDLAADDAVNYGGIGAVIGHEISHGFDNHGRLYDGDGKLRDWWGADDSAKFQAKADALVKQYDGFAPFPDLHVNGKLTLGENIADISGIAIAYRAYHKSLGGKPAPVIDGFTGDQRFFMGFAQIWREKMRDEYLRQLVVSNEHAPDMYRVPGTLRNVGAFYIAFGVKPGDGMYLPPEQRVKIW